jgi:hypothetical protein
MLTLTLPEAKPLITAGDKEVLLVTNADLRESANVGMLAGAEPSLRTSCSRRCPAASATAPNAPTCTRATRARLHQQPARRQRPVCQH